MNRTALFAAALAAVVGFAMLWLYKERFEAEASGGAKVGVLIATRDIPLAAKLAPGWLAIRQLPEDYLEPRHIRADEAAQVAGIRVRTAIKANESILWSDLATTGSDARDLAGLLRPGMRALAIPATLESTFDGLLRPGDRVDTLLTTTRVGSEERLTMPLEQNLLVLAIGRDVGATETDGRGSRRARTATVTLAVTFDQAQTLAFAMDRGELTLALRHPDDIAVLEDLPETTVATIMQPAVRRARIRRAVRGNPPSAAPAEQEIERVQ